MVNEGAIYWHYMFYLKHEWPLMTHEWPWTKISCSTFGLSFWLNPERDGCCVCLLFAGEQAPRRKYAAPPSIHLGFHPDRKKNSENQLGAEKQSYMIVWFLLFSLISRCFNEIDEEPFSSDYSHSCLLVKVLVKGVYSEKKLNFIWPFHYKPVILYRLYPKRNIN